ncbi:hypothetical protein [Streptomyces sp. 1331.2]|uniref:hypothetical protein n=1 Tax=Streptomyces sp. 1331.2 TaxID=1938835 RepID=UPI000BCB2A1C|nr:hypothetical protein [Streptomyces sp. 1331.2]SOB88815.1 hypothetical protein SAMN06272789_7130 [Streptomyces sp. 1331.2]
MPQDHPEPPSTSSVENLLADWAIVNGSVLQAGSVHGDVHLHPAERPVRPTGPGTVDVLVEYFEPGQWLVVPSRAALEVPPALLPGQRPGEEDVAEWARGHGGVDFATTELSVTVINRSDAHLTLRGLTAEVTDRAEPLTGALVSRVPQGVSGVPELELDLDQERPELWEVDEFTRGRVGARPFLDRTHVRLAPDESQRFIVTARIRSSCCTWELVLAFRGDDGTEFAVRPAQRFRTTGLPVTGLSPVVRWAWFEDPPRFWRDTARLDWCSQGNPDPELPSAPRELRKLAGRFGPHLTHFLSTGTTGPEQQLRLAAVLPAVRLAVDLVRADRKGRHAEAARLRAELRRRFPRPILEQAYVAALLAAGLTHGIPPSHREKLIVYLAGTPAAEVLKPMIAVAARR